MTNNRKKVLIVDDQEKNRKLLKVLLQKSGYETIEAENGKEGIELALNIKPDLILMDIKMPVMDGITATKMLKSDNTTSKIPVIIVTSSAMKGDEEHIMSETRCDYYITKPVDIKELPALVKRFTGG